MSERLTLQLKPSKIAQLVLNTPSSPMSLTLPTSSSGSRTNVLIDTTEHWNAKIDYIPARGTIIVYSDRRVIDGVAYPAIKIGDGGAYLIDLPFIGDDNTAEIIDQLNDHINNKEIHVTKEEKEYWNNKLDSELDGENLIFAPSV